MEDQIHAVSFEYLTVALEISRVLGQILVRSELDRVDEDGRDRVIVVLVAVVHQGRVSLVEISHGRAEADGLVRVLPRLDLRVQFSYRCYDSHIVLRSVAFALMLLLY